MVDAHRAQFNDGRISAARWYQLDVTGGTVAANTTQAANHEPDNTVNRFMPSLAVDRVGDMMIGYSASNASMNQRSVTRDDYSAMRSTRFRKRKSISFRVPALKSATAVARLALVGATIAR